LYPAVLYQQTVTLGEVAASATRLQVTDAMPATFRNGDPMIDSIGRATAQVARSSFQRSQFPLGNTKNTVLFQAFLTSSRILSFLRTILRTVRGHIGTDLVSIPSAIEPLIFPHLLLMRGRITAGVLSRFL